MDLDALDILEIAVKQLAGKTKTSEQGKMGGENESDELDTGKRKGINATRKGAKKTMRHARTEGKGPVRQKISGKPLKVGTEEKIKAIHY